MPKTQSTEKTEDVQKLHTVQRLVRTRCTCGSRLVKGKCLSDHNQLRKDRGAAMVKAHPLIVDKHDPEYTGLAWTDKKIRLFQKMYSNSIHDKTLSKKINCPSCKVEIEWGAYTFSGCHNKECAEYMDD